MSIAPVKCSVDVKGTAARAFEIFSKSAGAWWPRGKTPARNPHVDLIIEPKEDGRWFERDAEGRETRGRSNLVEWLARMNERQSMSLSTWEAVTQLAMAS